MYKIIIQKDKKEVCVLVREQDKDNLKYLGLLMRKCFNAFDRKNRRAIIKSIEFKKENEIEKNLYEQSAEKYFDDELFLKETEIMENINNKVVANGFAGEITGIYKFKTNDKKR